MAVPTEPVTDAELAVLKLLWTSEQLTAREVTEALYEECTPSTIATVQKLIQRLEAKGYVLRDRSGYVHKFSPRVSQAALAGSQLEALASKITNGSLAPFISHLVNTKRLSKKEKEQIRRLLRD